MKELESRHEEMSKFMEENFLRYLIYKFIPIIDLKCIDN